jgi:hypothetical protein
LDCSKLCGLVIDGGFQMIDVHLPTTDGRTVILPRYTQPEEDHRLLLDGLKLQLPAQPKPRITTAGKLADLSSL